MARALTPKAIEHFKAGDSRREIPDPGQRGLYCIVQTSGSKSFAVRYRYAGMPRKLTLQPGISLAAARKAAADAMFELSQGRDPGAAKRQAREAQQLAAADTFQFVAEEYLRREGAKLRSADWRQRALERLVFPVIGARPIVEIRRSEAVRLLDRIEEKNGAAMADQTLAVLRRIFNWHATRSDDFRTPIVRGMARTKPQERARSRILSDDELRAVWKAADSAEGPFGRYIQILLLTAARRNEAADMRWSEISGTDWVLPASRNKVKVELTRPLSQAAQDVLAKMRRIAGSDVVFTSDGRRLGGFTARKKAFDKQCGVTGWTLHDLRRTARSLMSRAGVPSDHAERCLGHVIAGVRGTYDRHAYHSEMARAYEALAGLIERIVNPPEPNVVSFAEARA
jgi:integrase